MSDEPLSIDSTSNEYLINADELSTVQYINSTSQDKVLVDIGFYTATKKDLECLLNSEMFLNDSVMNAYIRILKAQPSINEREDGYAYLETTYNANMICGDTITSLRNKEEGNFRLYRTSTYLNNDMVFFPINIKDCHWYLVVINGRKGVVQVLDSKGTATRRPQLHQLVIH
ncbi:hypothetical protein SETIT_1G083700v2 [Setaria italica]|uniref:Ubiquitin-like protease family profile domain-containing protein n=1 Tax=Setaria italica TaxID=4555 RepID=A0A368PIL4_SETIT|nr:hypothetical protein SETIT_1G083700v2 [Setaria italica]